MRRLLALALFEAISCTSFRFEAAHADCWRRGEPRDCCSGTDCWDDFWTFERCCLGQVELEEVPDNLCLGGPAGSAEELRLDQPSQADPFVFLWDEKCGGTTFNEWLLASAHDIEKIHQTHISDYGWPNVIGTPFFLKTYSLEKLHSLEILSANVDWNIFPVLGCRAPVGRICEEFEAYLDSIRFDRLRFSGEEYARALRLDPPYGRLEVAKARLSRCVVSLQNEDFENHLLILRAFYPWLKRVKFPEGDGTAQNIYNTQESAFIRDNLPAQYREAIARYNSVDMELYQFGVERFYWQVAEARKMLLLAPPSYVQMPVLPLRSRDWEANWPFFQEQLPTAFLMRRLARCRITQLVSQCGRLVGERTPEGVDYKLPPALAEQFARLASDAYYSQSPERFYTLGFRDLLREVGQVKSAEYQEIRIPDFHMLWEDSWRDMQEVLTTQGLPQSTATDRTT
ncbi:unnamed protein product [Symbiodinium sp. CCMP2592]|nr:unnamed protein product [Symbiodinium sp. CCMP2592]